MRNSRLLVSITKRGTASKAVSKPVQSRVIVNMGGQGSCRATAPRNRSARQEPRPPGLARWYHLPKSATAPCRNPQLGFCFCYVDIAIFVPSSVRSRGKTIVAHTTDGTFAGMVIVVRPDAPARRIAEPDEAEIHLLAVDSAYRGNGLGRILVSKALESIEEMGFKNTVLWTQPTMIPAHRLYESPGFVRAHERDPVLDGTNFFAYERKALWSGRVCEAERNPPSPRFPTMTEPIGWHVFALP
jgi:ribosomal protein S18 acetylase RimI-like enzyme